MDNITDTRKKFFISHCNDDEEIWKTIQATKGDIFDETVYDCFLSSFHGLHAGETMDDGLRDRLNKSDYMIAIITDSYIRSSICLQELSAFWFLGKPIIPIIYNGERGTQFCDVFFGSRKIYINAKDNIDNKAGNSLYNTLHGQPYNVQSFAAKNAKKWLEPSQFEPNNPANDKGRSYIGCSDEGFNIIKYCEKEGIIRFQNTRIDDLILKKKLTGKKEIYIIGTSSQGMIGNHTRELSSFMSQGTDIYILIGNKNSDFTRDVAAIESLQDHCISVDVLKRETKRAAEDEFESVKTNIGRIIRDAIPIAEAKGSKLGRLYFGNAFTLVRQTVTMGINEDTNELWAFVSVTMPPERASNGTMSFEIETIADDKNPGNDTVAERLKKYAYGIRDIARLRNALIEVNADASNLPESFLDDAPIVFDREVC